MILGQQIPGTDRFDDATRWTAEHRPRFELAFGGSDGDLEWQTKIDESTWSAWSDRPRRSVDRELLAAPRAMTGQVERHSRQLRRQRGSKRVPHAAAHANSVDEDDRKRHGFSPKCNATLRFTEYNATLRCARPLNDDIYEKHPDRAEAG